MCPTGRLGCSAIGQSGLCLRRAALCSTARRLRRRAPQAALCARARVRACVRARVSVRVWVCECVHARVLRTDQRVQRRGLQDERLLENRRTRCTRVLVQAASVPRAKPAPGPVGAAEASGGFSLSSTYAAARGERGTTQRQRGATTRRGGAYRRAVARRPASRAGRKSRAPVRVCACMRACARTPVCVCVDCVCVRASACAGACVCVSVSSQCLRVRVGVRFARARLRQWVRHQRRQPQART